MTSYNWKPEQFELKLPSGRPAIVQLPQTMSVIVKSGRVPDALADVFLTSMVENSTGKGAKAKQPVYKVSKDDLPDLVGLIEVVAVACLVKPKVVESNPNYEEGECLIGDVLEGDKQFLFSWAMAGGALKDKVTNFPE